MKPELEYLDNVKILIGAQKYDDALLLVNEGLSFYPESSKMLFQKGKIYYSINQYELAIQYYQNAIDKDPAESSPEYELGNVYFNLKQYELAIEHCQNAINKDPSDPYPDNGLGNIYLKLQQYELAIKCFRNAIGKGPTEAFPEYGLGNVYYQLNQYESAIEHYQNALNKEPDYSFPEYGLGNVYFDLKQYESAIEHYQNALNKEPDYSFPVYGLGKVYFNNNNTLLAKSYYLRFIALEGPSFIPKSIFELISFFSNQSQSPFVVEELLKKYTYRRNDLFDITEGIRQTTESIHLYLTYLKYRPGTNATEYNYLLAVAYFFMDLPFETFRIFESEFYLKDKKINLKGYYYWLLAASSFLVPDETCAYLLDYALDEIDNFLPPKHPTSGEELYYAGQIYWYKYLLKDDYTAVKPADDCFAASEAVQYLPAAYMRILTFQKLGRYDASIRQIDFVKEWESKNPYGPIYLRGYSLQKLDPNQPDILSPFLYYAHFYELSEVLEIVKEGNMIYLPDFHKAWELAQEDKVAIYKVVKVGQLNDLKDGIIKSYTEAVGKVFNKERARKLREEELPGINQAVNLSLENLFNKANEWKKFPADETNSLESHIAYFIHDWKIPTEVQHRNKLLRARFIYEQVIAYFMFNDDIQPLEAFSLTYYAFYTEERHKPKSFFSNFKDPSMEGVKETVKVQIEDITKTLITTGLDLAIQNIFPLKFFVGFTTKVIMTHFQFFTDEKEKETKLSAFDDYQKFKKRLDEKTLELIQVYQPVSELEQQALDIINGWYNYR